MYYHSQQQHVQRPRAAAWRAEHEESGERRREECSKKRYDGDEAGEHAEGQPIRDVEEIQSRRSHGGEDRHRQQLTDDVGTKGVGEVAQYVAHEVAVNRRE